MTRQYSSLLYKIRSCALVEKSIGWPIVHHSLDQFGSILHGSEQSSKHTDDDLSLRRPGPGPFSATGLQAETGASVQNSSVSTMLPVHLSKHSRCLGYRHDSSAPPSPSVMGSPWARPGARRRLVTESTSARLPLGGGSFPASHADDRASPAVQPTSGQGNFPGGPKGSSQGPSESGMGGAHSGDTKSDREAATNGGGTKAASAVYLLDACTEACLKAGAAALLDGRPGTAIVYFVQSGVYGFLPSLLVSFPADDGAPSRNCGLIVAISSTLSLYSV